MADHSQALTTPVTVGGASDRAERDEAASRRQVHTQPNDDISSLKKHFADVDLQSTEVRVLQEEGEHLSKLLKKAFPNDDRNNWTYTDLEDAVQKSRRAWESKERIGHGKPQKLFHGLMRKFDAHSNLFQFIPSGNLYASIVTGATAMLVKASVNHSKTIEELSDALDTITDAVSIGDVESNLIRSQAMQNAIAKLYIAIFLFLGDAAVWYKSSAASKVVHSLHKNFSERFRKSIDTITQLAANVRSIAQLGSQAEVRVVRLEVESLQDELQDIRVGMTGRFRQLAEYLHAQHNENMKQHEKTQELLADYKSAGMLPAPQVAELDYQRLIRSAERVALLDAAPATKAIQEETISETNVDEPVPSDTVGACASLREQLDKFIGEQDQETRNTGAHHVNVFERHLSVAVNQWLLSPHSGLLYLEYLSSISSEDTVLALGAELISLCKSTNQAVVPPQQHTFTRLYSHFPDPNRRFAVLMVLLAYEIYKLHSDEHKQKQVARWNESIQLEKISAARGYGILEQTLRNCPLKPIYVVLPGYPVLSGIETADLLEFLMCLRADGGRLMLKVIIPTHMKLTNLLPLLEPHEMALLKQQPGKNKAPKLPIVMPNWDT